MASAFYDSVPHPGLWADLILVLHMLVVAFVIGGQLLILIGWWRGWSWITNLWFRTIHLATIVVVALQAWLGRLCPLTIWEQQLRRAAGRTYHEHSFIEYWLGRVLYLDLPWWGFVAGYSAFAMLVLWTWWRMPPERRRVRG